jgi:hypothetical protein
MNIAVFMSYGTTLADWERQGILDREIAPYQAMAKGSRVWLFASDTDVSPALDSACGSVRVLCRPTWMHPFLYSLLGPLWHRRTLRQCQVFRSHNGRGLWTSLLAHWLFGGQYVVRFGYIWSWDTARRGVSGFKLFIALLSEWLACRWADTVIVGTPQQAAYLLAVHGVR